MYAACWLDKYFPESVPFACWLDKCCAISLVCDNFLGKVESISMRSIILLHFLLACAGKTAMQKFFCFMLFQ